MTTLSDAAGRECQGELCAHAYMRRMRRMRQVSRGAHGRFLITLSLLIAVACAGRTAGSTSTTFATFPARSAVVPVPIALPGQPAQTLTFEWNAANLALQAPYDTVQLHAIARTATGAVIPDLVVQYTTPDTDITVSATGLVTAHAPTITWHDSHVIASMTQDGQTLSDTAVVRITRVPLATPLAALAIHTPITWHDTSAQINLKDDPKIPILLTFGKATVAKDTICKRTDAESCPLLVGFGSSNRNILYTDNKTGVTTDFHVVQPGHVTLIASTIAYGVRKRDSLRVSVGYNKETDVRVTVLDASHHPPLLGTPRSDPPPYSVGVRILIANNTGDLVEVSLPSTPRGAHFVSLADWTTELPKRQDTLAKDAQPGNGKSFIVKLDSVGTYVLRYRHLNTGAIVEDTFPVRPYP